MSERSNANFQGWSSVGRWTVFGTSFCVLVSLCFNMLTFGGLGPEVMRRSMLSATVLPLVLAAPLFFLMSARLRGLTITNLRLGNIARTDSLTACLNRGAFINRVGALLDTEDEDDAHGALLMIDADNFKSINDKFGHDAGDEALRLIARAIRSVMRKGDLVGRLGGEEFGVYLPRADMRGAEAIAERIRRSVNLSVFTPAGILRPLSVSIGGAVYEGPASYPELFRIADQRLYGAKTTGRNRVNVVHVTDYPEIQPRQAWAG